MASIRVGQSELYVESRGEGPAVVLVHGVGGNHASWFRQVGPFAAGHRVVTFDQRGFGNSTDIEQFGRAAMADDLARLIEELDLAPVVLVAQSMGGGACVDVTCRFPGKVRALVLADTLIGLRLPHPLHEEMERVRAATAGLSQQERVLGRKTREEQPEEALLYAQIASFNSVTLKTLKGRFPEHDIAELAATGVPILFVVGEQDVLVPPPIARAVQECIPGSEFREIPGAGHSANFEAAPAFNACVLDFLRRLPPATAGKSGAARLAAGARPGPL